MASMLPQSPDMLRFATQDLAVNTLIELGGRKHNRVVSGSGATATLTAAQSGSLVLFDKADGIVFTLPAPVVGMWFDFLVSTTITSGAARINTDAATTFIGGTVVMALEATTPGANPGPKFFSGNAAASVYISMAGSTTGGILGTRIRLDAVSSTVWMTSGLVLGSGTIATIFN